MSAPALSRWLSSLVFLAAVGCSRPAEKLFEVSTDGAARTGMLTLKDGVVVVNEAGFITRVQADGSTRWRVPTGRELVSRAVEARGVVVVTSAAGEWFGILASNGSVPWEVPRQPVARTDLVSDGARVYGMLSDGAVRCIDGATGAVLWTRAAPSTVGKAALASPIIAGSSVIVGLGDAGVVALAWEDGAQRWRSDVVASALTASRDGKAVFVAGRDKTLRQLDATTGAVLWTRSFDRDLTTPATWAGDALYLGLGERVVEINPATGEPGWTVDVGAPVSPVARSGQTLLVPTSGQDGKLLLFAPPQTKPYATLRLDSPLRTAPAVFGDRVVVLASDGRVLGYKLKAAPATQD